MLHDDWKQFQSLCTAFLCHSYQCTPSIYYSFCLMIILPIILHTGRNFEVRHKANSQMTHKGMCFYWIASLSHPGSLILGSPHGNMVAVFPIDLLTPDKSTSQFSGGFLHGQLEHPLQKSLSWVRFPMARSKMDSKNILVSYPVLPHHGTSQWLIPSILFFFLNTIKRGHFKHAREDKNFLSRYFGYPTASDDVI